LRNARRAPNSVRQNSDQHLRVRVGRPVDLRGVAVLTARAPSRRSRGRSPIPLAQIARLSNPKLARVARRFLIVKKSKHQDHPGCRLKQWSRNVSLRSAPVPVALRPAAPQRAVRRFVVLVLTGQALVVREAVPASSGRARTGPDQVAQIVHALIEPARTGQDRTDQGRTDRVQTVPGLIAPASTAPAVHGQPAALAAPALGNLAQAGLRAPRVTARVPSPPAPANPAPAAPDQATSAPAHPQQENRRGSRRRVEPAGPLPQAAAAQSRHSAPGPAVSPSPATRASPAERGNPAAAHVPAANARVEKLVESPAERSAARKAPLRHRRVRPFRIAC
jgi:hypothetical protein